MVGRDAELRRLVRLAAGPGSQIALVAGEAGVGKSRLVQELLDGLPADTRVLVAQADPGALGRPFGLLLDAVDGLAPAGSADDPAPAGSVDPDALRILGDPGHSIVERLRAAAGIVQVLTAQPAVVVFEDLHWADPESTALFERIPDLTGRRLLVGTYRPDEVTRRSPVAELLTRLERRYPVTHLRLERLGLTETSVLLEAVSGRPPSYRAAASLHNRTGGNPYFLEELLRAGGDGGLDLERLCEQPLPWNLAEALRRQLDDVDPRQQRVVEAAAVLGHRVPFDVLAAVTELPEYDLIVVLRDLVRRGLMIETGEDEFGFRHALAREAVADQLLGRERRRLHELALDALLAAGDADPALVARHARGAGRYDDLIRAARSGCARYLAIGAAHQALSLAEMGLEEAPDDLELRAGAARAAWLANLLHDAWQHTRRWARDAAAPADRSAALRLLARVAWEDGRREEAKALTEEILDIIDQLPRGAERAHAMGTVAQSYMLTDRLPDAIAWADRTIALADELDLPGVRLAAAVEKGSALLSMPDRVESGRTLLLAVAEDAEAAGEWLTAARALHNIIGIVPPSSLADGNELLERMRADAERAGFESLAVAAYFEGRARFAMDDGDLHAAITALEEGHRRERGYLRTSRGTNYHGVFLTGLALEAGDLDRAESVLATLTGPEGKPSLAVLGLVFHLACRRGDAAAAEAALDDFYAGVDRIGAPYGEQVHDLVAAGLAAGLPGKRLRPLTERVSWSDAAHRWRALVFAQLDEADGRAAEALVGYEEAAGSPDLGPAVRASAHAGAARCLIDLGHVDRAREHVAAAAEALARWGGWRVAEVDALRGRVGLPAPAAVGIDDAVLTPREREVAALIAEGLTNAELARRLYISKKTAAVHVSNILGKLGLSSRTQVAAWLQRHRPG
ncbi:LuxR family transcriptional regulator [Planosporangium mesophilum]|uniref:LuxR family transcriptional regulator n=2 Tax=Planosporangium mesophilum TaxID=689768 RepID=A0A8J3T8K6_9ACTN|nr:LuxR family transcriptional regulator [Planosporangium mesophilum]NJC83394.1 AAA family ATPase [Planosporangium mesophilum]GII21773.1 LuxR family transcriptional regulator [Planosporangium mesophilum]